MIYFSAGKGRMICSCNTNYIQEGTLHPDRILKEYDFLYLKKGTWEIYENDICYDLKEKQLLILEPDRHHYSLKPCSPGMHNMYLHCSRLPGDLPHAVNPGSSPQSSKAAGHDPLSDHARPKAPGAQHPPDFFVPQKNPDTEHPSDYFVLQKVTDCSGSIQIERLFLQLIETYWSACTHRILRLESLFTLLLAELESCAESSICTDPVITEIIHQFYLHPDRFFSPQELADTFHISVRSLSSRFKKATGTSLHRYQIDLKLGFASEQIPLYPQRRFKDIALDLGFYDEFQFSRLFKRRFGYSPSDKR